MQWIIDNKEWLFGGLGITILGAVFSVFKRNERETQPVALNNTITVSNTISSAYQPVRGSEDSNKKTLDACKNSTRILFIDDDSKFKVVQILRNSGWAHTKTVKDVKSLDCPEIIEADILFVDIQGVGKQLGFADEGLGLADAIKEKFPKKRVVIYSAETKGDRFHSALRNVDSFLAKNADPYEFQQIVEDFALGK